MGLTRPPPPQSPSAAKPKKMVGEEVSVQKPRASVSKGKQEVDDDGEGGD